MMKFTAEMDDRELEVYCEKLAKDVPALMSILRDRDQLLKERNELVEAAKAMYRYGKFGAF